MNESVTLVLLPGLAADAAMWQAQMPVLGRPKVADVHFRHDRIESMAAALLRETPGPLALCGASMGGMVAMQAARQAPDRVRALALLGTNARPETPDVRALREAAIELFAQGRVDEVLLPNIPLAFHAPTPALSVAYLDLVRRAGAEQLIRQNQAVIARPDARVHLGAVRGPTLVLCGRQDQLTPPECSEEIAALVPGARLEFIDACGHMLTMEQPDAVNAALLRWWEAVRSGGAGA